MNDEQLKETYISGETLYDGKVVHLERWEVGLPNGQTAIREVIKHIGAAAVVPIDADGNITGDEYWNINGSYFNIEGITSPDGRIYGKMCHAERRGDGVSINIVGEQDMKIFRSGVAYFTE